MKKVLFVACLLVAALLTSRCDLFGGKDDFFPMGAGSIWNYTWMMIVTVGGGAPDTTSATVRTEAKAEDQIGGEDVMMFVNTYTDSGSHYDTSYAKKNDDGLWMYSDKNDTTPDQLLAFPLEVNKTWTVNSDNTAKAIGQESVTVPAGTYGKAWKIEYSMVTDSDTFKFYQWFASGTGFVKYLSEASDSLMSMTIKEELSSATIK